MYERGLVPMNFRVSRRANSFFMKFQLVWVGSDDDPPEQGSAPENAAAAVRPVPSGMMYERRETGLVRREQLQNGHEKVTAVTNFSARIVRDIILDDDATQSREFGMEAELGGQRLAFVLTAAEFGRMGWVLRQLGPQAIIYPGQQQHARAAIQWLSSSIKQERIFTHLGWKTHEGHWVYLHAGGALGSQGPCDWSVELPSALQHFQFHPSSVNPRERGTAVLASLRCLSVAPDWISFPLLAAVYRAALGKVDFSLFVAGQTGVFKSALAALCQQHFGAAMDARSLPANFASTGNALQGLAFYAKDSLLVGGRLCPDWQAKRQGLREYSRSALPRRWQPAGAQPPDRQRAAERAEAASRPIAGDRRRSASGTEYSRPLINLGRAVRRRRSAYSHRVSARRRRG
jgi:hypothetical protein